MDCLTELCPGDRLLQILVSCKGLRLSGSAGNVDRLALTACKCGMLSQPCSCRPSLSGLVCCSNSNQTRKMYPVGPEVSSVKQAGLRGRRAALPSGALGKSCFLSSPASRS